MWLSIVVKDLSKLVSVGYINDFILALYNNKRRFILLFLVRRLK